MQKCVPQSMAEVFMDVFGASQNILQAIILRAFVCANYRHQKSDFLW